MAEWSKALRLGRSPKGRRFEPCRYHFYKTFKAKKQFEFLCVRGRFNALLDRLEKQNPEPVEDAPGYGYFFLSNNFLF